MKPTRRHHKPKVDWSIARRGEGFVAVLHVGGKPIANDEILPKKEARALARKLAAKQRRFVGLEK